ncbi:MAG: GspB domain-containing protein [Oceanospirillales bacterium]|nr:GspB domain-containing protein [Oceanospirillales bacterium]MBR9890038.1 GspB domain-containing protein [Oceanospirillales bacterium]
MSYILDALKQSDQQRTAEPVQPLLIPANTATGSSASRWRLVLIAVVLAGIAVIWFSARETPDNSATTGILSDNAHQQLPATTEPAQGLHGVKITLNDTPAESAPISSPPQPNTVREPRRSAPEPVTISAAPPQPAVSMPGEAAPEVAIPPVQKSSEPELIYWRQLPVEIQRSLPQLSFTVHIYASDPTARMVKVNGRILREGDTISTGLVLDQITPDGVVLEFRRYRFRMSRV